MKDVLEEYREDIFYEFEDKEFLNLLKNLDKDEIEKNYKYILSVLKILNTISTIPLSIMLCSSLLSAKVDKNNNIDKENVKLTFLGNSSTNNNDISGSIGNQGNDKNVGNAGGNKSDKNSKSDKDSKSSKDSKSDKDNKPVWKISEDGWKEGKKPFNSIVNEKIDKDSKSSKDDKRVIESNIEIIEDTNNEIITGKQITENESGDVSTINFQTGQVTDGKIKGSSLNINLMLNKKNGTKVFR